MSSKTVTTPPKQMIDKNIPYNTAPNGRKYISCGVLEGKPIVQTTYT